MVWLISAKRRHLILAGLVLCANLAIPVQNAVAAAASGADAPVRAFYAELLDTMRNGLQLGVEGRYAKLAPTIRQSFDIPFMPRLSIGLDWNNLTQTQQGQVTEAFARYVTAIYAERFSTYLGQQFIVTGEQASPGGTVITSQIIKANGEPVHVNYLMRQNGSAWQIVDVYFNGTISELATRRSEFSAILRSQGINGLIAALNDKATSLGAPRSS